MMDEKGIALEKLAEVSASQNEFVDDKPALQDRTTYYYRLVARNSGGAMSQQTAVASATTKPPPAAPANLAGTSGEIKKTDLSWDRNRETDIKEYQVFVKRPTDADFRQIQGLFDNRYRDSDLKDGADYVYKIRVIDKDGLVSDFSGQVVVKTKPLPAKVTGFKAVDAASRKVAWNQNQEKDVRNYNVYKKGFLGAQQKLATVQSTQWQLDDTKGNVELYVTAIDESGLESEPSDMVVFRER
jgi:titin